MNANKVSTGSAALDGLISGGLEPGILSQFYGEPGCGKSAVCLLAAVETLRSGRSVMYIDTEGFSVERFAQIAGEEADRLAERLYLFEPTDFDQQGLMISDCERLLQAGSPVRAGLIVMDSATALYRAELSSGRDGLRRLGVQMIRILGLGKKYGIPVLITNQVFMNPDEGKYYGLGGTALRHLSKVIVRIEREDGHRRAVLEKHRSLPEGASFQFVITEQGIKMI